MKADNYQKLLGVDDHRLTDDGKCDEISSFNVKFFVFSSYRYQCSDRRSEFIIKRQIETISWSMSSECREC